MEQTIFRAHRTERDRWTPILNDTIRDQRISFRATGLLIYLLSLPPDWKANQQHIALCKTEGRDAMIAAWNELRAFGYIEKEIVRERGKIMATIWNVYEQTSTNRFPEKPETVQPETVQPVPVNPTLRSNEGNEVKNVRIPLKSPRGRVGFTEGSNSDLRPTTPQSKRFAALVHRSLDKAWDEKEIKAYKKLGMVDEDDLSLVERYYAKHWPPREGNILRRSLLPLLNNFAGEVDRARADLGTSNGKANQWTNGAKPEPEGWRDWVRKTYPDAKITTWKLLPEDVRREAAQALSKP